MATEQIIIQVREDGSRVVSRNLEEIGKSAQKSENSVLSLKRALYGFAGALGLNQLREWLDIWTRANGLVNIFTHSLVETNLIIGKLFDIAQATRQPLESVVKTFHQMSVNARALGASQTELIYITELVGKAFAIQGTPTNVAKAGILQLGHAFSEGIVRARQFNSMIIEMPRVLEVAAKYIEGANGSLGKLRQMMLDGKLTSRAFFDALVKGSHDLDELFSRSGKTIGQAFTVLENAVIKYVGEIDKSYGASQAFFDAAAYGAKNIDNLAKAFTVLVSPFIALGIVKLIGLLGDLAAAAVAFSLSNPFTAIALGVTAAVAALTLYRDQLIVNEATQTSVGDYMRASWQLVSEALTAAFKQIALVWDIVTERMGSAIGTLYDYTYRTVNAWIGIWVGAYGTIKAIFSGLGPAIADIFYKTINGIIGYVELGLNAIIKTVNKGLPEAMKIPTAEFGRLENDYAGKGADLGNAITDSFGEALNTDYIGKAIGLVGSAFTELKNRADSIAESRRLEQWETDRRKGFAELGLSAKQAGEDFAHTDEKIGKLKNQLRQLLDKIDPAAGAVLELARGEEILSKSVQAGLITGEQKLRYMEALKLHYQDIIDPMGAYMRSLQKEFEYSLLLDDQRKVTEAVDKQILEMRKKGIVLSNDEVAVITKQLELNQQMNRVSAERNNLYQQFVGPQQKYVATLQAANDLLGRGVINTEQFIKATRAARVEFLETQTDFASGYERAMLKAQQAYSNMAELSERTVNTVFDHMGSFIDEFIDNGTLKFKDFFIGIAKDLLKLQIKFALFGQAGIGIGGAGFAASAGATDLGTGGGQGGVAGTAIAGAQTAFNLFSTIKNGFSNLQTTIGNSAAQLGSWLYGQGAEQIGTFIGTNAQFIGQLGGTIGGYLAGSTLNSVISGQYQTGSGVMTAEKVATAVASFISPVLGTVVGAISGLINRAFGMGNKNITGTSIQGSITPTGVSGSVVSNWTQSGGWFRSDRSGQDVTGLSTEVLGELANAVETIKASSSGFAKQLGVDASFIDTYSKAISITLTSDTKANEQAIADFIGSVADDIANSLVPGIKLMGKNGETMAQTLERLSAEFAATDQIAALFGKTVQEMFGSVGIESASVREQLINFAGGLQALGSKVAAYQSAFYTDAEKIAPVVKSVDAAMSALGLSSVKTKDQFKAVVESIDVSTQSGARLFTQLLDLAPAFAAVADYTASLTTQVVDNSAVLKEQADLQSQLDKLTLTSMQLREKERLTINASNLALFDQITAQLQLAEANKLAEEAAKLAADKTADIARERSGLQDQLDKLTMTEIELRAKERNSLDESNRSIYDQIVAITDKTRAEEAAAQFLLDQQKAIEEHNKQVLAERQTLQDQYDELTMSATQLLNKQRGALDESNRALFDQINAIKQQQSAAEEAARVAEAAAQAAAELLKKRGDLETELFNLTHNSVEQLARARQLELLALDESLRPLMMLIYAQQDAATAADELAKAQETATAAARQSAQNSLGVLDKSISYQKGVAKSNLEAQLAIIAAQKSASQAYYATLEDNANNTVALAEDLKSKLNSLSSSLKNTLESMRLPANAGADRAAAKNQISQALAVAKSTGILPDSETISQALKIVSTQNTELFGSYVDFARDFYTTAGDISQLSDITDQQLSAADQSILVAKDQLAAIKASAEQSNLQYESQVAAAQAAYDLQISQWDTMYQNAKDQLDIATGSYVKLTSIETAFSEFNSALSTFITQVGLPALSTLAATPVGAVVPTIVQNVSRDETTQKAMTNELVAIKNYLASIKDSSKTTADLIDSSTEGGNAMRTQSA